MYTQSFLRLVPRPLPSFIACSTVHTASDRKLGLGTGLEFTTKIVGGKGVFTSHFVNNVTHPEA